MVMAGHMYEPPFITWNMVRSQKSEISFYESIVDIENVSTVTVSPVLDTTVVLSTTESPATVNVMLITMSL